MNRKKTNRTKKPKRARHQNSNLRVQHSRVTMPRELISSEVIADVTYLARGKITNAGNVFATQRWHTNCPYDVDPIVGSTSAPGYNEWAAFFDFQHTIGYKIELNVFNAEAFALGVYTLESTEDPGTASTLSDVAGANPLSYVHQLGPATGLARKKIVITRKISQVTGTILSETADSYRSVVNSTPADKTWIGIGVQTYGTNVLTTAGLDYELKMSMRIRFSGRKTLSV